MKLSRLVTWRHQRRRNRKVRNSAGCRCAPGRNRSRHACAEKVVNPATSSRRTSWLGMRGVSSLWKSRVLSLLDGTCQWRLSRTHASGRPATTLGTAPSCTALTPRSPRVTGPLDNTARRTVRASRLDDAGRSDIVRTGL